MKTYLIKANITGKEKWHLVIDKRSGLDFIKDDYDEHEHEHDMQSFKEQFPDAEVIDLKKEMAEIRDLVSDYSNTRSLNKAILKILKIENAL